RCLAGPVRAEQADAIPTLDSEGRRIDEDRRTFRVVVADLHLRRRQHVAAGADIAAHPDVHPVVLLRTFDPFQAVELLLASPGLAISLAGAVFPDELLLASDVFLLFLVLLEAAGHPLLAHR